MLNSTFAYIYAFEAPLFSPRDDTQPQCHYEEGERSDPDEVISWLVGMGWWERRESQFNEGDRVVALLLAMTLNRDVITRRAIAVDPTK